MRVGCGLKRIAGRANEQYRKTNTGPGRRPAYRALWAHLPRRLRTAARPAPAGTHSAKSSEMRSAVSGYVSACRGLRSVRAVRGLHRRGAVIYVRPSKVCLVCGKFVAFRVTLRPVPNSTAHPSVDATADTTADTVANFSAHPSAEVATHAPDQIPQPMPCPTSQLMSYPLPEPAPPRTLRPFPFANFDALVRTLTAVDQNSDPADAASDAAANQRRSLLLSQPRIRRLRPRRSPSLSPSPSPHYSLFFIQPQTPSRNNCRIPRLRERYGRAYRAHHTFPKLRAGASGGAGGALPTFRRPLERASTTLNLPPRTTSMPARHTHETRRAPRPLRREKVPAAQIAQLAEPVASWALPAENTSQKQQALRSTTRRGKQPGGRRRTRA